MSPTNVKCSLFSFLPLHFYRLSCIYGIPFTIFVELGKYLRMSIDFYETCKE